MKVSRKKMKKYFFRLLEKTAKKSLTIQLIVSNILIVFIVLGINAFFSYNLTLSIVSRKESENTLQNFKQIEYSINYRYRELESSINAIVFDDWMQRFLDNKIDIELLDRIYVFRDFNRKINSMMRIYDYIDSVYLFKNNGTIFGVDRVYTTNLQHSAHPFYGSDIYEKAANHFPRLVLDGNLTTSVFSEDNSKNITQTIYVSAARSIARSKHSVVLVINMKESSLSEIYSAITGYKDIYIVNDKGNIISHTNKAMIGQKFVYADFVDDHQKSGHFSIKESEVNKQIIYYSLDNFGWKLISEVPYDEFMNDTTVLKNIFILSFSISVFLIIGLYSFLTFQITKPLKRLIDSVKEVGRGKVGTTIADRPNNEVGILMDQFNIMSVSIKKLIEHNKANEEEKRNLEIEMLQAQINPHFLYNTLNMVKWMAAVMHAENIVKVLANLGNMLKIVFKKHDVMCTIRQEIEFIQNYISIMNLRYDNHIALNIHAEDKEMDNRILRFILQPIIENCIVHGMGKEFNDVIIDIHVQSDESCFRIEVSDNGKGMSEEVIAELNENLQEHDGLTPRDGWGIGLGNVQRRIGLHYGLEWGISIKSVEKGSRVIILLPAV